MVRARGAASSELELFSDLDSLAELSVLLPERVELPARGVELLLLDPGVALLPDDGVELPERGVAVLAAQGSAVSCRGAPARSAPGTGDRDTPCRRHHMRRMTAASAQAASTSPATLVLDLESPPAEPGVT